MFYCPHDAQKLERLPTSAGAQWRCPTCEGRSVSLAVLRRVLDRSFVNSIWQTARSHSSNGSTECPLCRNVMCEIAAVGDDETVRVDVCVSCHSLWFDTHELTNLEARAPAPVREEVEPPLPAKAREAIALAEIQRIRSKAEAENPETLNPPAEGWQAILTIFGFPVEEDAPGLSRYPVVTWLLGAILILLFVAQMVWLPDAAATWGFVPTDPLRHGGLTFLTSFFLHGNWVHLAGNLIFLLMFGDNVEDFLGHLSYLGLVVIALFAGDALHWLLEPRGDLPSIGASGGISGILAFYALKFPRAKLVYLLRFGVMIRWIRFPAFWGFVIWMGLQLWTAWDQSHGLGNVSGLAHLGGAAVGVSWWAGYRLSEGLSVRPSAALI